MLKRAANIITFIQRNGALKFYIHFIDKVGNISEKIKYLQNNGFKIMVYLLLVHCKNY